MQSAPCRALFQPARATIQTANPTVTVSVAYSASTFVACRLSIRIGHRTISVEGR